MFSNKKWFINYYILGEQFATLVRKRRTQRSLSKGTAGEKGRRGGSWARVLEGRIQRAPGEGGSGTSAEPPGTSRTYKAKGSENTATAPAF